MRHLSEQNLVELGLSAGTGLATSEFCMIWNIIDKNFKAPSFIVEVFWAEVTARNLGNNVRGSLFEILIGLLLLDRGVEPFFRQSELAFVNNARFDYVLWEAGSRPIALSIKTSLRERYKQAMLESDALKAVHRNALTYLITLDQKEWEVRTTKEDEKQQFSSIDDFLLATSPQFDAFLEGLSQSQYSSPRDISPQQKGQKIQTTSD